ncbi:unnamed protein product [Boreogadus saida]
MTAFLLGILFVMKRRYLLFRDPALKNIWEKLSMMLFNRTKGLRKALPMRFIMCAIHVMRGELGHNDGRAAVKAFFMSHEPYRKGRDFATQRSSSVAAVIDHMTFAFAVLRSIKGNYKQDGSRTRSRSHH